jgi:hypothetical protein
MTRLRSNAVCYQDSSYIDSTQADLLAELRQQGIARGIHFLGALDVKWEDMLWQAAGKTLSVGLSQAQLGPKGPAARPMGGKGLQDLAVDATTEKIGGFLKKVIEKARAKLSESPWVTRATRVLGLGLDVLLTYVKQVLLSKEVIGAFIPFWNTIKGGYDAVMRGVEAYRIQGSIELLAANAALIGSGIPSVAMRGFGTYLRGERNASVGASLYTFGKTIASTVLTIVTAGAGSLVALATKIVELVVSLVSNFYQAWVFSRACEQCRTWDLTGSVDELEDNFSTVCAGCPLLGAYFFAVADYIGTINLTSMFAKGRSVVADSVVWTAGAQVFEVQKLACDYITKVQFQPTFRSGAGGQLAYLLEGIKSTAAASVSRPDPQQSRLRQLWTRLVS